MISADADSIEHMRMSEPRFVEFSEDARLAVWRAGSDDASNPIVWVHANGFSGRMWIPVIESLECRPDASHIVYDLCGQGLSSKPAPDVNNYDWGLQAEHLKMLVRSEAGRPVDAVGHSMGGAIIALAAADDAELFRSIVLFEPIIPVGVRASFGDPAANPLVAQARRRRAGFASLEECRQRLGSKPPYSFWDPKSFELFLETALVPVPGSDDGAVQLACPPEIEATNYIAGGLHDAYEKLPSIECPALLLQGSRSPKGGPLDASALTERLPNATYDEVQDATHFAPFENPRLFAEGLCKFWSNFVG
jgi:lipase